jgi:hypothetical protein
MTIVAKVMVSVFGGTATNLLVLCASVRVGLFGLHHVWNIGLKSALRSMGKLSI